MAALGISAGRGRNEFDRYLSNELDDARLLPFCIADTFRGSDIGDYSISTSSCGVWNWRDADILDDFVVDVSTEDLLTNLTG